MIPKALDAKVRMWQLMNRVRRSKGNHALRLSPRLCRIAEHQVTDFVFNGYFAIRAPDGLMPVQRLEALPYRFEGGLVVIFRSFYPTPEHALQYWLERWEEDLLDPHYKQMGIAKARKHFRSYWVLYLTD